MNGTNNDSDAKAYADGWQDDDGNVPVLSPEPEAGKEFKGLQEKADAEFNDGWNSDLEPKASDSGVVASPVIGDRAVAVENLPAIEPAKPMSFKETFAAQRKAGATVFEWNGKKYTTDLKKPAAKSATGRAPAGRPAQPQSLTQKMGANFSAAQSAVDNMPHTADGKVRQALTSQRDASLQAYEQAASAEKSGTPGELPSVEIAPGKTILAKGHMPKRTK